MHDDPSTGAAFAGVLTAALRAADGRVLAAERVPLARARGRVLAEPAAAGEGGELPVGEALEPTRIASLAALGLPELRCARRPTIALLAIGDDLRMPGMPIAAGQRFDALRPALLALFQQAGLEPTAPPVLPAATERLRAGLGEACAGFDLVLACGAGDALPALLDAHGECLHAPPGRGLAVGAWGQALMLGLPRDPREAWAAALALALPVADALQGRRAPRPLLWPSIDPATHAACAAGGVLAATLRDGDAGALAAHAPSLAAWPDGVLLAPPVLAALRRATRPPGDAAPGDVPARLAFLPQPGWAA